MILQRTNWRRRCIIALEMLLIERQLFVIDFWSSEVFVQRDEALGSEEKSLHYCLDMTGEVFDTWSVDKIREKTKQRALPVTVK